MIGYVKGRILSASNGVVLIENNGIGYEITCSSAAYVKLTNAGEGEVYTYMAVREDGVYLYGFENLEEKSMFLKLITVSGVGPKMGITILSGMKLSNLALAIATSDVKTLSKVKGCGKRTAERIILELREKISSSDVEEVLPDTPEEKTVEVDEDAVIALMSLGFTRQESVKGIERAMNEGAATIEQIIAFAIKGMR